ncbi:hypothetical protein I3252_05500 [Psychrobacter sp. Ps4]|uniref:hypothetical protein n=1 Tax=Psychrobacter sp. Ps4 TaxID=2790958 RepID=UPI001EDE78BC|nr:hypothetical protein [Psychrobacter sp. Ps4]MCG3808939.1 hypothetical protein [Psychrobacter sp. Ps4]
MKKTLLVGAIAFICVGANAAYTFPENAVTSEKNRIVSLESLNYKIDLDEKKTMDELRLCLAELIDNDNDFIKAETDSAIIVKGSIRIDKNSWGNDELVNYELKALNNSDMLKLKYYNLGFGYIKPNQNPEDVKVRKPATHFGGGGKETIDEVSKLHQNIKDCIEF